MRIRLTSLPVIAGRGDREAVGGAKLICAPSVADAPDGLPRHLPRCAQGLAREEEDA